jgi:hypothetical protein
MNRSARSRGVTFFYRSPLWADKALRYSQLADV